MDSADIYLASVHVAGKHVIAAAAVADVAYATTNRYEMSWLGWLFVRTNVFSAVVIVHGWKLSMMRGVLCVKITSTKFTGARLNELFLQNAKKKKRKKETRKSEHICKAA